MVVVVVVVAVAVVPLSIPHKVVNHATLWPNG
jgi:hypothetical protein